jgi:hypothetical protein
MFIADNIEKYVEFIVNDLKSQDFWDEFVSSVQGQESFTYGMTCNYIRDEANTLLKDLPLEHLGDIYDQVDTFDQKGRPCVDTSDIDRAFDIYEENGELGVLFSVMRNHLLEILQHVILQRVQNIAANVEEETE